MESEDLRKTWTGEKRKLQRDIQILQQNLRRLEQPTSKRAAENTRKDGDVLPVAEENVLGDRNRQLLSENAELRKEIASLSIKSDTATRDLARLKNDLRQPTRRREHEADADGRLECVASNVTSERLMDLHRELATREQEVQVLRSKNEIFEIEVARLQQQLTEAARETTQNHARLLEAERVMHSRVRGYGMTESDFGGCLGWVIRSTRLNVNKRRHRKCSLKSFSHFNAVFANARVHWKMRWQKRKLQNRRNKKRWPSMIN